MILRFNFWCPFKIIEGVLMTIINVCLLGDIVCEFFYIFNHLLSIPLKESSNSPWKYCISCKYTLLGLKYSDCFSLNRWKGSLFFLKKRLMFRIIGQTMINNMASCMTRYIKSANIGTSNDDIFITTQKYICCWHFFMVILSNVYFYLIVIHVF